jgi:hypothetical protein
LSRAQRRFGSKAMVLSAATVVTELAGKRKHGFALERAVLSAT